MCRTMRLISLYPRRARYRVATVCIDATYDFTDARFRPVQMKRARRPASGSEDEERGIILWFHWCTWVALPHAATASAHVCFVPPICLVCTLEDLYSRFICHLRLAAIRRGNVPRNVCAIMTFVPAVCSAARDINPSIYALTVNRIKHILFSFLSQDTDWLWVK